MLYYKNTLQRKDNNTKFLLDKGLAQFDAIGQSSESGHALFQKIDNISTFFEFVATMNNQHHAMAASVGAMITTTIVTPLDVVKVRLQAQLLLNTPKLKGRCNLIPNHCTRFYTASSIRSHQNTTWSLLRNIAKYEGIVSLWRGFVPSIVVTVPTSALYLTSYEKLSCIGKDYFPTSMVPVVAGAVSRVLTASVVSPLEVLRTKTQATQAIGSLKVAERIFKREGLRGYYRGYMATLARDVPFSAIYWSLYEPIKRQHIWSRPSNVPYNEFIAGALAGIVAAIVTTPFDVVKTMQQVHINKKSPANQILVDLIRKKGAGALFTGVQARVVRIAPACAIMISTYEFGKNYLVHQSR